MAKRGRPRKAVEAVNTTEVLEKEIAVVEAKIEEKIEEIKELQKKQYKPLSEKELKVMKSLQRLRYSYPYLQAYQVKELQDLEERYKNT